jgi:hypothetical protein
MPQIWKIVIGVWLTVWSAVIGSVAFMANIKPDDAFDSLRLWWAKLEGWIGPQAEWWLITLFAVIMIAPILWWVFVGKRSREKRERRLAQVAAAQAARAGGYSLIKGRSVGSVSFKDVKAHGWGSIVDADTIQEFKAESSEFNPELPKDFKP